MRLKLIVLAKSVYQLLISSIGLLSLFQNLTRCSIFWIFLLTVSLRKEKRYRKVPVEIILVDTCMDQKGYVLSTKDTCLIQTAK